MRFKSLEVKIQHSRKEREEMKLTAGTLVTRINEIQELTRKKTPQQKEERRNEINRRNFSYED